MPFTPSEQLVYDLCKTSFLSLWSYANPKQLKGKELCDVLAVFGRHVILFSVKEITLKPHADPRVAADRWIRRAVDESIGQLRTARRVLPRMEQVIKSDGSSGVRLPPPAERIVHSIAVAAGGNREVPFGGGFRDGEYVHVIDEVALRAILGELDTAPDFLHYLEAKESFKGVVVCEGEENFFATYLHSGREFPDVDRVLAPDGLWAQVQAKPEFKARKAEDEISYWWDQRIERVIEDSMISTEAPGIQNDNELVVRTMASETRFERRVLSTACIDWLRKKRTGGRVTCSPKTQTGYVFLTKPRDGDREVRVAELMARCMDARSPNGPLSRSGESATKIIGLATEIYDPSGWSMDVVYLDKPQWSDKDEAATEEGREIFTLPREKEISRLSLDEFPIQPVAAVAKQERPGRNDPCPCGSGRKWKKCHGA
jgi:hypothetical protein